MPRPHDLSRRLPSLVDPDTSNLIRGRGAQAHQDSSLLMRTRGGRGGRFREGMEGGGPTKAHEGGGDDADRAGGGAGGSTCQRSGGRAGPLTLPRQDYLSSFTYWDRGIAGATCSTLCGYMPLARLLCSLLTENLLHERFMPPA